MSAHHSFVQSLNGDPLAVDWARLMKFLDRANQIASVHQMEPLLTGVAELMLDAGYAGAAMVYLMEKDTNVLVCRASHGDLARLWLGARLSSLPEPLDRLVNERSPQFVTAAEGGEALMAEAGRLAWRNAAFLPLVLADKLFGFIQVVDLQPECLPLMQVLVERLVSEVKKVSELQLLQQHNEQLDALVTIFGQIGATLDRDQILGMIIDYARDVMNVEASSLFLVDEERNDIYLYLASNLNQKVRMDNVRVPHGKGIIGHVVQTGEVVLVPDVSHDERHYGAVDQSSGFITRSILAVPLRSRQVVLGGERGTIKERVIGGFEAINKLHGTFDDHDARLLITLANQAATVLEIADLYADANELFFDVVKVMTAAIDAKDPYTEGHSQRVSDFSVEVAREMGLSQDVIHHIRIGSLLHDVGKIGIPDFILSKPGRLTDEEFEQMKAHPMIGERIMREVRMLNHELPAIAQHHERLDGRGYPGGLVGEHISLFGRIVAVADVFDALTSDRPYRKAQSAEEALDYLFRGVGHEFDAICVDALVRAYTRGSVVTQKERELLVRSKQA